MTETLTIDGDHLILEDVVAVESGALTASA
jgi:hypothetical protein